MAIIEPQENEIVDEIRVVIGSHISVVYWNRETRQKSRPDMYPYTRANFAEVRKYGDDNMFLLTGTKSDWVWSSVPF